MQDVHFFLFVFSCLQHVIGPFFYTQRIWLFEIFKPISYQMNHTTKGVFFFCFVVGSFFFPKDFDYCKYSNPFHNGWIIQQKCLLFVFFVFWMCKCVSNLETKGENTRDFLIKKLSLLMSALYLCKLPSNWDSMHQNPSWMHIFTLEMSWMRIFTLETVTAFYKAKLLFQSIRGNQFCS